MAAFNNHFDMALNGDEMMKMMRINSLLMIVVVVVVSDQVM